MKRAVAVAVAAIVTACIILTVLPWGRPSLDAAENTIAMDEDGRIFLAENRGSRSYIYGIEEDGSLSSLYEERNRTGERCSAITQLCAAGDGLYYVRSLRNPAEGAFTGWELYRLDLKTGKAASVLTGNTALLGRVGSLAYGGGKVYLTGVDEGGKPSVSREQAASDDLVYYGNLLAQKGVIQGFADGSYDPGSALGWGELLKMAVTAVSASVPEGAEREHWAQKYLDAAREIGLASGSDLPDVKEPLSSTVKKYELALILSRASEICLGEGKLDAPDAGNYIENFDSIPARYSGAVAQCYAKGLLEFSGRGLYGESETVSRGSAIEAIIRLLYPETRFPTAYNGGGNAPYQSGSSAAVYVADVGASEHKINLLLEVRAPAGTEIAEAAFDGETLYCLLGDGRLMRCTVSGTTISEIGDAHYSSLGTSAGGVWVYDDRSASAVILSGAFSTPQVRVSEEYAVVAGTGNGKGNTAVLAADTEGNRVLLLQTGRDTAAATRLRPGFWKTLSVKIPVLRGGYLGFALLGAAALTVYGLLRFGRRLTLRIITATFTACVLAVTAISGILYATALRGFADERIAQASAWGAAILNRVGEQDLAALTGAGFYGSVSYAALEAGLLPVSGKTEDGSVLYTGEVYTTGETQTVAVSRQSQYGLSAARSLPPSVMKLVILAAENSEPASGIVTLSGRSVGVYARPVAAYGDERGILLTTVTMDDLSARTAGFVRRLFLADAAALALCFLLLFLFTRGITSSMQELIKRMNTVTSGKFRLEGMRAGPDEIGTLWKTMREMSVSLGIRDYETKSTLSSYYRFVPRGIDKLLGRANIMEVSFGDSAKVSGTVGLISIGSQIEFGANLGDRQFMQFVNRCFGAVNRSVTGYNGLLLSGDFDLSSVRAFFPDSADDGVRCSLSLLGELGGVANADMTMFLHEASFLYGVAGTEERAFPFLSSAEMSYIASLAGYFRNAGVKVVVTEQCLKSLRGTYATRYIGFVSSEDGTFIYKLHELLDAYPDTEKALRLQNDKRFQEAVQLFYKNDFYLARNIFSGIVRACPQDGIARWYLFAAERYYNAPPGGGEDKYYNLFGLD